MARQSDICRQLVISRATFYNSKSKYSGMEVNQLKQLRELQDENRKLKAMYADLALDHRILKEIVEKKALRPCRKRLLVEETKTEESISTFRACRIVGLSTSVK